MAEHEERLARLEEGLYFQEKKLEDLDEALQQQQAQIDMLQKKLTLAEERLARLLAQSDQSGGMAELPPHFMPEKY